MYLSSGNMAVSGDAAVQEHSAIKSQPYTGTLGSEHLKLFAPKP